MLIIGIAGGSGSGKSTVAALLKERGYVVIEGDVYKTSAKMLKAASGLSASTVFDATNPSREKRAEYVKWAQERHADSLYLPEHQSCRQHGAKRRAREASAEDRVRNLQEKIYNARIV